MEIRYIKIIGLQFDALEGLTVISESNAKDHIAAGKYAQEHANENTIFLGIPCSCSYKD